MNMKKNISIVLIVVLLFASFAFCVLWQRAVHDKSNFEAIAQAEANETYRHFLDYQTMSDESDYWGGVSSFYAFREAYTLLTEGTNKTANSIFCNEIYGCLLCSPERARDHISEIIDIMEILSDNVWNERGYLQMAELRNTLQE